MRPHHPLSLPWHGCVHRSPTFWFGVAFLAVGLFDAVGADALSAFLQLLLGENASAKTMIVVGVVVPIVRFLTITPLLEAWRSPPPPEDPPRDPSDDLPEEPPHA